MGKVASYSDLKFPLRPVIRMALGSGENILDTDDILYIPYNYLVSATFNNPGRDSDCEGSMELIDPSLGPITEFLGGVRQSGKDSIRIQWGWQDSNGMQKLSPMVWNMRIGEIALDFQNGRIKYDIKMIGPTVVQLMHKIQASPLMSIPMKRLEIVRKIVDDHNKIVPDAQKIELEFVPSFTTMVNSETDSPIEHYNCNNRTIFDAVLDLLKSVVLNNDNTDHIYTYSFTRNGVPFMSIRSSKVPGGIQLLDSLYDGKYVYNNSQNTNIISMNLKNNNWISFFGTKYTVGTTNMRSAEQEIILSSDDAQTLNIGTSERMDDTQSAPSNTINLNPQVENKVNDADPSSVPAQKYINRMENKLKNAILEGSIVTLGDPNIFHPTEHVSSKFITIMSYDNNGRPMPAYCGNFRVKSWSHSFTPSWTTTIDVFSMLDKADTVRNRQENNI